MKISKSSWHYWLVSRFNSEYNIPESLCPYVRKIITSGVLGILCIVVVLALLFFFIVSPVMFWLTKFGAIAASAEIMKIGTVSQAIWLFCICGLLGNLAKDKWKERRADAPAKEPGVFMSYVKAKKQKFCPTIEFVDEVR